MPALQSLVVTDRAGTPVNYTLVPDGEGAGSGVYTVSAADATGVSISKKKLSISRRKSANGRIRTTIKMYIPVMATEVINGVSNPVVIKEGFVDLTFNMDPKHTEQERNDIVGMLASALGTTKVLINDTVVKDQDVY